MSAELIAAIAAIAAAVGAYIPLLVSSRRRAQDIAAWRASVDSGFDSIRDEMRARDTSLGREVGEVKDGLATLDGRQHEMTGAIRELAGVAGRALGRTERDN